MDPKARGSLWQHTRLPGDHLFHGEVQGSKLLQVQGQQEGIWLV